MNGFKKKIFGGALLLGLSLSAGISLATTSPVTEAKAADPSATYQHVFTTKPSTGNKVNLSGVDWNVAATSLNGYQSAYAGVQIGSSSKNGKITLTSSAAFSYQDHSTITEVRLWLNLGGTSVTPTVTIGGANATSDGTKVAKNSNAGSDWTKATKVTFTPASGKDSGVVVVDVATVKAGYICALEIDVKSTISAEDPLASISASGTPTRPIQLAGKDFDPDGLTFTGTTQSGAEIQIPASDITWDALVDQQPITGTYGTIPVNLGDLVTVTTVSSVSVAGTAENATQYAGATFNPAGLVFTAGTASGKSYEVNPAEIVWDALVVGKSVTGRYEGVSVDVGSLVSVIDAPILKKITSTDNLFVGMKVVIGNLDGSKALSNAKPGNNFPEASVTESLLNDNVDELVLGIEDMANGNVVFTFLSDYGYLYAASSSKNYLKAQNEVDDNARFTVTINSKDGSAAVQAQGTNTRNLIRHNSSSGLFSCYASGQEPIALWAADQTITDQQYADTFVAKYMHMTGYVDNAGKCKGEGGYYEVAKAAFEALSEPQKTLVASNTAAYARLQAWAIANGETLSNDFVFTSNRISPLSFQRSSASSIALASLAAFGAISLGGLFLLRKKKHN